MGACSGIVVPGLANSRNPCSSHQAAVLQSCRQSGPPLLPAHRRHEQCLSGRTLSSALWPELASGTKLALYMVPSKNKNHTLYNKSFLSISISNWNIIEQLLHAISEDSSGNRQVGGNLFKLHQPGLSDQGAPHQSKEVIHTFAGTIWVRPPTAF